MICTPDDGSLLVCLLRLRTRLVNAVEEITAKMGDLHGPQS